MRGADVRATFVLSSLDLDPDAVSLATGIHPTRALHRGDPILRGTRSACDGSWQVTAERLAVFDIDGALSDVLDLLRPGWTALVELGRTIEAHFLIGVDVYDAIPSLVISGELGQALVALNAWLEIDVHADLAPVIRPGDDG